MRLQMKGLCDVWLRYRVNSWVMAVRGAAIRIALTVQKLSLGCRPIVPARRASLPPPPSSFTVASSSSNPRTNPLLTPTVFVLKRTSDGSLLNVAASMLESPPPPTPSSPHDEIAALVCVSNSSGIPRVSWFRDNGDGARWEYFDGSWGLIWFDTRFLVARSFSVKCDDVWVWSRLTRSESVSFVMNVERCLLLLWGMSAPHVSQTP